MGQGRVQECCRDCASIDGLLTLEMKVEVVSGRHGVGEIDCLAMKSKGNVL